MDKHDRYKQSMREAGYVEAPRGWVTPQNAEKIKPLLVKKTEIISQTSCAQPKTC